MKFRNATDRNLFFAALGVVGLPPDMSQFLAHMRGRPSVEAYSQPIDGTSIDIYRNKIGGFLRRQAKTWDESIHNLSREKFMEILYDRINNDPKLYARMFVYEDFDELAATLLLAAGPPPKRYPSWAGEEDEHRTTVTELLRSLRAPSCNLNDQQFESCVQFKYTQFTEWCKRGGKFRDVDSDQEKPLEA